MGDPRSVLLIKPGSLGDIVHALPAVGDVRRSWPETHITWLVDRRWRPLLEGMPGLDAVVEFPRESFRGFWGAGRFLRWLGGLNARQPDVVFDLQGLLRSALMGRALRAGTLVGGSDAREGARWWYDVRAKVDTSQHAVRRYRQILSSGGVNTSTAPTFPLGPGQRPQQAISEPFLLLHPYARGTGKSLDPDHVRHLTEALFPCPVVLAGQGPSPQGMREHVLDLLGKTTLGEFLWLARSARWVVSVDSGPAHIAAAVNDAVLCVHTWSDPRRVGPFNEQAWVWRGGEIYQQNLSLATLPGDSPRVPNAGDIQQIAAWLLNSMEAS